MRSLLATAILFLNTTSAFARDNIILALPEPSTMFLLGVAGGGLMLVLRKKK